MSTKTNDVIKEMTKKIDDGTWIYNMQLPSEVELAKQFNVSRATMRQALQEMAFSGRIIRVRGVGTFVGHKAINYGINELVSITGLIRQNGYEASITHVSLDVGKPEPVHCEALNLAELEPVYTVQRVFSADSRQVVYEEVVYPVKFLTGIVEKDFLDSSFKMLEKHGIQIKSSEGDIRPYAATAEMAALLEVKQGSPLLLMETALEDQNQQKICYVKDYFTEWFTFPIRRIRTI